MPSRFRVKLSRDLEFPRDGIQLAHGEHILSEGGYNAVMGLAPDSVELIDEERSDPLPAPEVPAPEPAPEG